MTTHMDGNVDLIDPDSGALYTFVRPEDLTSDPDLSNFCAACHDADGATRLGVAATDPFGNGNVPPDAATKLMGTLQWDQRYGDVCWGTDEGTLRPVNSHHDISDADQGFSGAKLECLNCHGAHNASASQPVADPFNTTTAWAGSGNDFCLACHSGGNGPLDPAFPPGVIGPVIDTTDPRWPADFSGATWDTIQGGACKTQDCSSLRGIDSCDYTEAPWWVDYAWSQSAHGPNSKRGWNNYSGAPSYDVACTDCHDPHGSYSATNPAGNPYMIRDTVDGTSFVDDGSLRGGFNGPPWETFGVLRDIVISIPGGFNPDWGNATTGLCGTCHSDWYAASTMSHDCEGCQTCHGHGMAWGESDLEGWDDHSPCPIARGTNAGISAPTDLRGDDGPLPPLHLRSPAPLSGSR